MLVSLPSKENRRWFIRIATPYFYESKANNIAYGLVKDVHTMSYPQISHNPLFLPPWSPDFFPYHHLFGWTPQNRDVPCELPGNHHFFLMVLQCSPGFFHGFSLSEPSLPISTPHGHFGVTSISLKAKCSAARRSTDFSAAGPEKSGKKMVVDGG